MVNQIKIVIDDGVLYKREKDVVLYDYVGDKTLTYRFKLADLTPEVFELHIRSFDHRVTFAKSKEVKNEEKQI